MINNLKEVGGGVWKPRHGFESDDIKVTLGQ